jgi:NADH-quinone oxidoreductase E subunit
MKEVQSSFSRQEEKNILARLKEAQEKFGYVTEAAITGIADSLGVTVGDVYGVATFYSFLSVKPLGRNVIRICQSLPCYLKGAETVIKSLSDVLGIAPGETTPDGRFTLDLTNCIGACDLAPAMLVNGELHGNLSADRIAQVLDAYK